MGAVDPKPLPPELRAARADFLDCLRAEAGLARATLAAYGAELERFLRWLGGRGIARWHEVEPDHVVAWLAHRRESGRAEATVAHELVSIRMLARFLVQDGRAERDPTALLAGPRLRRSLPHALGIEEVEELLAAPAGRPDGASPGDPWRVQRDCALLEVLYACGARVSEAAGLRTDALERDLSAARLFGKGGKTRLVPLGARARAALELWLGSGRRRLPGAARRPEVFLTKSGRPLDRVTAWRRVKLAARRAGLPPTVSPHTLRHSFATHLLLGGADLRAVGELLGHASIRTTEVYTHVDAEHVRGLHRLYHPRA